MLTEEYGFAVHKGGLASYESVMRNGKPITSAVREITDGKGKVTITYADGCVYTLECGRAVSDGRVTLTDVSETWYNGKETIDLGGDTE